MTEKGVCPHCGEPVYATDEVCMSCGKSLGQAGPPLPRAPEPTPSAAAGRRPRADPLPGRIVFMFGDFWDVFPWLALIMDVLPVLVRYTAFDPRELAPALLILFAAVISLWGLALVIWIIVDVLDQEAGWWWIPIAIFFCHPIGLILYLLTGRD